MSSPSGDHQQGMCGIETFFLELNLDSEEVCCGWDRRLCKVSLAKNLGVIPAAQPSYPITPHPQHGSSTELPCLHTPCALSYLQREAEAFSTQAILN